MTNIFPKHIHRTACVLLTTGVLACAAHSAAPPRIVTLGGAVTETVFALGAGGEVVARDMSSVYPKEATALPDVGYFRTIGAEGVLSQNPTLILAARGTGPESQVQVLEKSGVQLVRIDTRPSADAAIAMITQIGGVLHREDEAATLAATLKSQLEAVVGRGASRVAVSGKTPRVAFLIGMGPATVQAAGQGTAADALIALVGGANAFADVSNYKSVSSESLLASDPDVIFYGVNPAAPSHTVPDWISQTRAGREKRVYPLDLGYHLVFGPRLGDAAMEVSKLLFPADSASPQAAGANAGATACVTPKTASDGVLRCPVTGKTYPTSLTAGQQR
ncbi:ABC transporter substrate-binding protein [Opitutaceae bacterium TAV4]|nr:ABC transporter substrate-binding protein [Opitutaceae bacterium TAV4]RRJ98579.1 ABC transporter substrate-binding protein [Opitutaceae bacterium TAV3]